VLVATRARRHKPANEAAAIRRGQQRTPPRPVTPRPTATTASVTRKVDSSGNVSFAGTLVDLGFVVASGRDLALDPGVALAARSCGDRRGTGEAVARHPRSDRGNVSGSTIT